MGGWTSIARQGGTSPSALCPKRPVGLMVYVRQMSRVPSRISVQLRRRDARDGTLPRTHQTDCGREPRCAHGPPLSSSSPRDEPAAAVERQSRTQRAAETSARWPRFRGPDSNPVSDNPNLPVTWSRTENVEWVADVPGVGWSSPVVWGTRVFLTAATSEQRMKPPSLGTEFSNEYIAELRKQGLSADEINKRLWARDREMPQDIVISLMLFCYDLESGKRLWERRDLSRSPAGRTSRQEQLRVGDAGHRRQPRLRVLYRLRPVRLRFRREADLGHAVRAPRRPSVITAPAPRRRCIGTACSC